MILALSIFALCSVLPASSFGLPFRSQPRTKALTNTMSTHFMTATSDLYEPAKRDAQYGKNVAQYLLDLHDSKATFDFCGGMMFQLVLSDMLKDHLTKVAVDESKDQPFIHDSSKMRMFRIPDRYHPRS
uniref:Uncharacterized protein n=1 Tax=Odontella aurita TaxID=265563 RepID=A0A7S4IM50_9STRA|mmetsp:Transcript_2698/g.7057  ORF Transcript_2698/g.7057 Transcript_2698/m.7057 type:complete len:129 (+) Transcript_2698:272-658(+)